MIGGEFSSRIEGNFMNTKIVSTNNCSGWSNKSGTSSRSCACGNWKAHWGNFSTQLWPSTCSVQGCNASAEVGAHIYKSGSMFGNEEWIAPFCRSCNGRSGVFDLKNGRELVSANKSKTCEKPSSGWF